MTNISRFSSILLISLFLSACGEPSKPQDTQQLARQYKELNILLTNNGNPVDTIVFPFSEHYLKQKSQLLDAWYEQANTLDEQTLNELELLIIEQRYTERFFPWPFQTNPVKHYAARFSPFDDKRVAQYINHTRLTMESASKNKIKLGKEHYQSLLTHVEHAKEYLQQYPLSHKALSSFSDYLSAYLPRRTSGLGSLPNGKEWYQTRLNYFVGTAIEPKNIINQILILQPKIENNAAYLNCFGTHQCSNNQGIDWRTNYSNRKSEFIDIQFGYEQSVLAEVDFGVHLQNWTTEHALTVIKEKLRVNDEKAKNLFETIIDEPALAMVNLPLTN